MLASSTISGAAKSAAKSLRLGLAGRVRKVALLTALLPLGYGISAAPALPPLPAGYQPTPAYQPPAYQPGYQPAQVATGPLTLQQLASELQSAGYPTQMGQDTCITSFQRDGWNFNFTLSVSDNHKFVWVSTNLTRITDMNQVSPAALLNLLHENDKLGTAFFSFDPTSGKVEFSMPIVNENMTVAEIHTQVEQFVKYLQATQDLWSAQTLTPGAQQAAAPQYPQQPQYPRQPRYPQYVPQQPQQPQYPQPPQDVQQ